MADGRAFGQRRGTLDRFFPHCNASGAAMGLSRPETGPFDMQCSKRSRTPDLSMCLGIVTLAFHGVTHVTHFESMVDSLGHVGMIVYGHMLNENCRDAHICIICPTVAWLQAAHPRPEGSDLCQFFHAMWMPCDQCGCPLKAPCLVKNMQIRAVSTFRSHMGPLFRTVYYAHVRLSQR